MITIEVNVGEVMTALTEIEREHIPFAVSVAIDQTARDVQTAIQDNIRARMTIRRDWVPRYGVKIPRFSSKRDRPIAVEVLVPKDHDFLWKFEDGETKRPRGKHLAIPISARPSKAALVPASYRPAALELTEHTTKSGKVQVKGAQRTFIIPGVGIFQRTGPARGDVRLLYKFQSSAPTPSILQFEEIAERVALRRWPINLGDALDRALATAR